MFHPSHQPDTPHWTRGNPLLRKFDKMRKTLFFFYVCRKIVRTIIFLLYVMEIKWSINQMINHKNKRRPIPRTIQTIDFSFFTICSFTSTFSMFLPRIRICLLLINKSFIGGYPCLKTSYPNPSEKSMT